MFYEEIIIKQCLSYISFCSFRILYKSNFILMATSLGTNAVVITRVHRIVCLGLNKCNKLKRRERERERERERLESSLSASYIGSQEKDLWQFFFACMSVIATLPLCIVIVCSSHFFFCASGRVCFVILGHIKISSGMKLQTTLRECTV